MDMLQNLAKTVESAAGQQGQQQGQQQQGQQQGQQQQGQQQQQGGGDLGSQLLGKLNNVAGGGAEGEAKEDMLDKAIDMVQEKMGGGDQSNEDALEQMKDKQIAGFIRNQYKNVTGSDFPISEKN